MHNTYFYNNPIKMEKRHVPFGKVILRAAPSASIIISIDSVRVLLAGGKIPSAKFCWGFNLVMCPTDCEYNT